MDESGLVLPSARGEGGGDIVWRGGSTNLDS
jgi:hypothetical protein